jgi:2-polyprenyl-3-methyl-5-hydroxy-6-metoxy-1,4-benzoquinol methylase
VQPNLPSGIPTLAQYDDLLRTPFFATIRSAASAFLEENAEILAPYQRRWVSDPLHQWSRQWEYPYALAQLEKRIASVRTTRILDAGAGVTFFPYLLAERHEQIEITCADADRTLTQIHAAIRSTSRGRVHFGEADLRALPYSDRSFDAVYCLSVLEHTRQYDEIVDELHRVLRPGGTLIVSFDISVDGEADIPLQQAKVLIDLIERRFPATQDLPPPRELPMAVAADTLTTAALAQRDHTLMPWPHPLVCLLKTLRRGRWPKRWGYTNLTFACHTFERARDE